MTEEIFEEGAHVFHEGDAGDAFFIIVRGEASVRKDVGCGVT